jgi:hypothetical protein
MTEVEQVEVHSPAHMRNAARINKDEEELRELMKKAGVVQDDETQEETTDSESDSEGVENTSFQDESVLEQEKKEPVKAKAQEEDTAELSAEEKTFKQRYGDLRRHMQEKEKEVAAKLEKLEKQLELATSLKEIEELRITAKREKAEAELAALHPDFGDIRADDVFHEWAKDQPKWVQDALYENVDDAKSVARVIDLYKVDKGITGKKTSSNDKEAASSVRTKRNTTPEHDEASKYLSESQVAKMSIKEYEKRMDEIMEAQRSGKFIYDMSKK